MLPKSICSLVLSDFPLEPKFGELSRPLPSLYRGEVVGDALWGTNKCVLFVVCLVTSGERKNCAKVNNCSKGYVVKERGGTVGAVK